MDLAPKYVTEVQVAEITGRALSTLRNERFCRRGIPYVKIGRSVRYNLQDVIRYMESNKITTSQGYRS
jgi:phage terminase Nu1 subunit (DNA packaging protein)